ncbi:hypothetical protein ACFQ0M_45985 [Kitasatospora aburaviensis]
MFTTGLGLGTCFGTVYEITLGDTDPRSPAAPAAPCPPSPNSPTASAQPPSPPSTSTPPRAPRPGRCAASPWSPPPSSAAAPSSGCSPATPRPPALTRRRDPMKPIGYWLNRTDQALTATMNALLAEYGLTRLAWQVLNVVEDDPQATDTAVRTVLAANASPPS